VILDEIQRVPELLSYIQVIVDSEVRNGQFVLTGSHQLALHEAISQSLAGRTGILNLYPFSIDELSAADIFLGDYEHYIFQGFLPRIYDQHQRPTQAYSNYYQTYVERDVRQLINLKDIALFEKFIKLIAGRVGQLMDYSSLANDVGVSANTIKEWLSILEASFIVYKLSPYFENFGKGLLYGYALEIILRNTDKNLKKILMTMETNFIYLNRVLYKREIQLVQLMLKLTSKETNPNYLHYITVAIELNLTENQAKGYSRTSTVNQKSFSNRYSNTYKLLMSFKDSNIL